ncbi:MAG: MBL fold metallo-hydrolase, partial [Proteobacteria bacterium]|nr:MBL fold metallo-hydrolase [Pseudomonadota bacterium]
MIKKILLALLLLIVLFLTIIGILMWKELGQSPKGERLARIQQSPNYKNGAFQNDPPSKMFTSGDSSQKRERPSGRVEKAPSKPLPAIKTDLKTLERDKDLVIWFGHSSVLIQQDGIRYLIDPVFDSRFPISLAINPYKGTDIYTPEDIPDIDYLIITHDHWDHLDYKTVLELKDRVKSVVCGLGVGQHFEYWGYPPEKIHELDWGESLDINKDTKLYALEARHFSGRLSGNPTLWASF